MAIYQIAAKEAKSAYFSSLISRKKNSKALFKVIGSVVSGSCTSNTEFSPELAEEFLNYFVKKVENIKTLILSPP